MYCAFICHQRNIYIRENKSIAVTVQDKQIQIRFFIVLFHFWFQKITFNVLLGREERVAELLNGVYIYSKPERKNYFSKLAWSLMYKAIS